jgi:hypothetical protein
MKPFIRAIWPLVDFVLAPFVYPAALLFKAIRKSGIRRMPFCRRVFMHVGVFPIRNHYYEPLFDTSVLKKPLDQERNLPGIDWNIEGQLTLLKSFSHSQELLDVPTEKVDEITFHMNNGAFESGDAEFLYNMIRLKKPKRIFEIGCGNSTLIAIKAVNKNVHDDAAYRCKHLCIEPYEMPWLEKTGLTVIRQRVENVDLSVFSELERGDILFIDSSHMIRPQGDVLFEFLELLPTLKDGVIVHVHDIFSPRDYMKQWVIDDICLWNEQYLLEAFLTDNKKWRIIGAVNHLHHNYYSQLKEKCPFLEPEREPLSFYMEKV